MRSKRCSSKSRKPGVLTEDAAAAAKAVPPTLGPPPALSPLPHGATEIPIARGQEPRGPFWGPAIDFPVLDNVEDIGMEAARRAINDQQLMQLYQNGGKDMTKAGTMFHRSAELEANSPAMQSRLPAGWRVKAEERLIAGGKLTKPDILIRGPAGAILEVDWKTTAMSALETEQRMDRRAAIIEKIFGKEAQRVQYSRHWTELIEDALARAGRSRIRRTSHDVFEPNRPRPTRCPNADEHVAPKPPSMRSCAPASTSTDPETSPRTCAISLARTAISPSSSPSMRITAPGSTSKSRETSPRMTAIGAIVAASASATLCRRWRSKNSSTCEDILGSFGSLDVPLTNGRFFTDGHNGGCDIAPAGSKGLRVPLP